MATNERQWARGPLTVGGYLPSGAFKKTSSIAMNVLNCNLPHAPPDLKITTFKPHFDHLNPILAFLGRLDCSPTMQGEDRYTLYFSTNCCKFAK
jgi:hypothetical protein